MVGILTAWLEKIFPERKDYSVVRLADLSDIRQVLLPTEEDSIISLLPFQVTLVRAAVHEAKFQNNPKAQKLLSIALLEYLKHCQRDTILIPIPLGSKRARKRGYNQVHEIAKLACKEAPHITLRSDLLYRVKDTIPQTTLSKVKRRENVIGVFGVRNSKEIEGANIIILDDVSTTGATLKAAHKEMITYGPSSITLLSLAH